MTNSIVCIVSKLHAKKGAALQRSLSWQPHKLIFVGQAKIDQQGSEEYFDDMLYLSAEWSD